MPSLFTHAYFGYENEKEGKQAYLVGTQGPDPFFYYGVSLSWRKKRKLVREFGSFLHHLDPARVFAFMEQYIAQKTGEEREVLQDYFRGYLSHYCLDRTFHPYVYAIAGLGKEKKEKYQCTLRHTKMESEIDYCIREFGWQRKKPKELLSLKEKEALWVSHMMKQVAVKFFYQGEAIPENCFALALKDMRFVTAILYSEKGKKGAFFHLFHHTLFDTMTLPKKMEEEEKKRLKNEDHTPWKNRITGEKHHESMDELWEKAKAFYVQVQSRPHLSWEELVGEIDYDGFPISQKAAFFNEK